jgi:hypothetical protein
MSTSSIQIEATFERVFCQRHGEVFRSAWPKGYPIAVIELIKLVTSNPALVPSTTGGAQTPKEIVEAALDRKPACCWAIKEQLLAIYSRSSIGQKGYCETCGRSRRLGVPFLTRQRAYNHVCFECALSDNWEMVS